MGRFIFDWPDELAARVEAHRKVRGFKTTAETVRELLELALTPTPAQPHRPPEKARVAGKVEKAPPRPSGKLSGPISAVGGDSVKRAAMPKGMKR